nr:DUF4214 domain-containing protein [uncultured Campylobacter sp.]
MAVTKAQVAQLYVALFNRAPEGAGLNAWFAAGATKTQAQLADDMLRSPAVQSYFNGRIDTDRGFVSNIYKNFLGKDYADDPAGIESWVRHLEAGHSRGETLVKLFEVAQTPEAIAAAPVAAAIFRNKTAVSAYMAEKIADIAQRDDGTYDYEPFQAIIRGTTDTNLEEQKAKVDQLASGQTPSTNKNLTAETDNIVGTDGDDTFNGVYYVGDGAKTSTLSSLDTLDGKAGKDTLNLTVQKNGALPTGTTGVLTSDIATAMRGVSNIENLNIRSEIKFQGNADISMGLDNLSIQTIGDVATTTDTKEKVTIDTTGVVNLTANDATKEITAKSSSAAVTVTANKLEDKVSIDAGAGATLTAGKVKEVIIKAKGDANITADKATKVNINLNDQANTLTIATSHPLAEATEVTLSSLKLAADLAVAKAAKISTKDVKFDGKAISTDIENVDFSMEYTGNNVGDAKLTASAADKVKTLSINAKAQKSATLTIDSTKINSLTKVTVKGDAKDLTLDLSAQTVLKDIDASAFTGNFAEIKVGNVENSTVKLGSGDDVVALTATASKQTIDGGAGTDLVSVTSNTAEDGAGDKVTFNNFEGLKISNTLAHNIDMSKWSGFTNITLADGSESKSITKLANNSTITLEKVALAATKNLTLGVKDADTGTDDTVNLVLDPKDNPTAGIANAGNIIVENIETVNITSKINEAKTSGLTNKIILKTGAAAADALKTITVKGDADTVLTLDATATKVKTVDASALEGKFTFDGTAHLADKAVIKGGAKDDTITVAGKSGASITGGADNDKFVIGVIDSSAPANDTAAAFPASKVGTITDFTRGDKISMGSVASQDSIARYESSNSLDFANNLSRASDAAKNHASKTAYFTYTDPDSNTTDTYVITSDATAGLTNGDHVVKLSGTIDLSTAKTDASGDLHLA